MLLHEKECSHMCPLEFLTVNCFRSADPYKDKHHATVSGEHRNGSTFSDLLIFVRKAHPLKLGHSKKMFLTGKNEAKRYSCD